MSEYKIHTKLPHNNLVIYQTLFPNKYVIFVSYLDFDDKNFEIKRDNVLSMFEDKDNIQFGEYVGRGGMFIEFNSWHEMWDFWNEKCSEEVCPYAEMYRPLSVKELKQIKEKLHFFRPELGVLANENI